MPRASGPFTRFALRGLPWVILGLSLPCAFLLFLVGGLVLTGSTALGTIIIIGSLFIVVSAFRSAIRAARHPERVLDVVHTDPATGTPHADDHTADDYVGTVLISTVLAVAHVLDRALMRRG